MTTLTDTDVAEILMELDRKNLLETGSAREIYRLTEKAWEMKNRRGALAPAAGGADDDAVAEAEILKETMGMLVHRGISRKRLNQIAEAMSPLAEKLHVTNLGT